MEQYEVWYQYSDLKNQGNELNITHLNNSTYTGVVFDINEVLNQDEDHYPNLKKIIKIDEDIDASKLNTCLEKLNNQSASQPILSFKNIDILKKINYEQVEKCLEVSVNDKKSLHQAIELAHSIDYLSVCFKDPTNIPLELVLASLQSSGIKVIKNISDPKEVSDAKSVFGVMQVGVKGVIFSPQSLKTFNEFNLYMASKKRSKLEIKPCKVIKSAFVGMGHRSCIDLATLFSEEEGLLVGSTSSGGVLCCSEVFHLPYMEKRPFRVNAGSVHSYIFNNNDTTNYLTELRSGSEIMVVDLNGNVRRSVVGRIKTEIRPLRLIEVAFEDGFEANIIMQDDWHVRVFSEAGKPANITELKPGDRLLGYYTKPGRHVGIRIEEDILEQ